MKHATRRITVMITAMIMLQGMIPHGAAYARTGLTSPAARALALPDARTGQPYEYQFTTSGGRPPFRWEVADGDPPAGIRLTVRGKLIGVPTIPSAEPTSFVVEVTDSSVPPERSERLVMLMVRPRPLSIEGDRSGVRIMGGDESVPVAASDWSPQRESRRQPPYAQRERDDYPREAPRPSPRRHPQVQEEDVEGDGDDDMPPQAADDEDEGQRDASQQVVGQGGSRKARILGRLRKGAVVIPVAASPHTTVTAYVNDEIAGRARTDAFGRAFVSIGEPLASGAKVKVEAGTGSAPPPDPPNHNGNGSGGNNGNGSGGRMNGNTTTSNTPPPNINIPVRASDSEIAGTATSKQKVTVIVNGTPLNEVEATDGTFKVKVTKPLVKGDKIKAKQDGSLESVELTVGPAVAPTLDPLTVGAESITGKGLPNAKIKVIVVGRDFTGDAGADGKFTIKLSAALRPSDFVKAQQNEGDFVEFTLPAETTEFNWGRVRAYFYGGAVFSNRNRNSSDTTGNDFTKVDLGVGFTLDKNYIMNGSGTFFVNTFFDTRLTAIPVTAKTTTPMTTTSGLVHPTSSGPVRAAADTMTDQFMTFLGSKKAGIAQVGLYTPIAITGWNNDGDPNRLFFAPLAKAGIQTITSGFTSAEGTRLGEDDVYNFFAFGARLGHYKLKYRPASEVAPGAGPILDTNVGPELISWLDLSYGRWENFDILVPKPNLILDPTGNTLVTVRERPWRVSAEGRLKIPATPFMVGFDGNFGKGPDDLRFMFGIRFDVGKLLKKLGILEKLGLDK